MNQEHFMNDPDELLHLTLMEGQARVLLARSTAIANAMAQIHQPGATALAAGARIMTGTVMLSAMLKEKDASVTVIFDGNGPGGRVTCVGHGHDVKLTMDHPGADLPPRADGHLDVGGFIGRTGRMSVIKDLRMKEPYVGQIAIESGEIGEEFARYYTVSEQQPSLVALGALVSGGICLSSGGILIQPLPGCPEDLITALDERCMLFSSISREIADTSLDELWPAWFSDMQPRLLSRETIRWKCECTREKFEDALISLGRQDLTDMKEQDHGAECVCHFCRRRYFFSAEDLERMLEKTH